MDDQRKRAELRQKIQALEVEIVMPGGNKLAMVRELDRLRAIFQEKWPESKLLIWSAHDGDIALYEWVETGEYELAVNSGKYFDTHREGAGYLRELLVAFEAWMDCQGYHKHTTADLNHYLRCGLTEPFQSIEMAYAHFYAMVRGYCTI